MGRPATAKTFPSPRPSPTCTDPPVGLRCGTGVGDIPFGEGEAILIVTIGPQVPAGYFAPVEVIMWSGADTAIEAGVNGMLLRLDFVQ